MDSNEVIVITMETDRQVEAVFGCGSGSGPMIPVLLVGLVAIRVLALRLRGRCCP